jgi:hypothetical protein
LPVCGGDFALDAVELAGREVARVLPLAQFQHPLDQRHHLVVPDLVSKVGETRVADGRAVALPVLSEDAPQPPLVVP